MTVEEAAALRAAAKAAMSDDAAPALDVVIYAGDGVAVVDIGGVATFEGADAVEALLVVLGEVRFKTGKRGVTPG